MEYPRIIQGGMGVAVSSWQLARAVAKRGQLGVVSGTAIDTVWARRLQLGDPDGQYAEAFGHFPIKEMADRVWNRHFISGGKATDAPFKSKAIPAIEPPTELLELTIVASFVEVWLAKQGHTGKIGINLLEKIQVPTLPTLYGAMLADVDVVLMGAGIPRAIPGILDLMAEGKPITMKIDVAGGDPTVALFDPSSFLRRTLKRPQFLAIVSSASLAQVLAKKASPPVDGFIVEGHTAGGHNAPPRGTLQLTEMGEPIYGERDLPDFQKFRDLGLPFWLAGSYGTKELLAEALAVGAKGIQIGTAFAFCNESGIAPRLKADVIRKSIAGDLNVFTDPVASPTGFPFKVVQIEGTVSEAEVQDARPRICDLGYLREVYRDPAGKIGYRCPAEPIDTYVRKGGELANTVGRKCVCNGLLATIGLAQIHKGLEEAPLITAGDDVANVSRYLKPGATSYSADDVIDFILN